MREKLTTSTRLGLALRLAIAWMEAIAKRIAPPILRIALALPFLRSGLTRWDGFLSLSPGTLYLFEEQFKLHVLGREYGFPAPEQLALLTSIAEVTLPVLLLVGLGTRFAACALLMMTGVIQLVFPDGWANFHLYWAALAAGIVAMGPGGLSIDHGIDRRFPPPLRVGAA